MDSADCGYALEKTATRQRSIGGGHDAVNGGVVWRENATPPSGETSFVRTPYGACALHFILSSLILDTGRPANVK